MWWSLLLCWVSALRCDILGSCRWIRCQTPYLGNNRQGRTCGAMVSSLSCWVFSMYRTETCHWKYPALALKLTDPSYSSPRTRASTVKFQIRCNTRPHTSLPAGDHLTPIVSHRKHPSWEERSDFQPRVGTVCVWLVVQQPQHPR